MYGCLSRDSELELVLLHTCIRFTSRTQPSVAHLLTLFTLVSYHARIKPHSCQTTLLSNHTLIKPHPFSPTPTLSHPSQSMPQKMFSQGVLRCLCCEKKQERQCRSRQSMHTGYSNVDATDISETSPLMKASCDPVHGNAIPVCLQVRPVCLAETSFVGCTFGCLVSMLADAAFEAVDWRSASFGIRQLTDLPTQARTTRKRQQLDKSQLYKLYATPSPQFPELIRET